MDQVQSLMISLFSHRRIETGSRLIQEGIYFPISCLAYIVVEETLVRMEPVTGSLQHPGVNCPSRSATCRLRSTFLMIWST